MCHCCIYVVHGIKPFRHAWYLRSHHRPLIYDPNACMRPVTTFLVRPNLPSALTPLREIAYNYWWCWDAEARDLFEHIDSTLWDAVHHNPVALLHRLPAGTLDQLAASTSFLDRLAGIHRRFRAYMDEPATSATSETIAYFCAEFGIHESFMNYSGGLGVLAGDHLKSASDLGLPLIGVGLLYQEGYFRQQLTQNGWQNERYAEVDFHALPVLPVMHDDGSPAMVSVDLPLGTCFARVWRLHVGRVTLYLLDTNIAENTNHVLRDVTDRLYGGTTDTRVMQELVLGIGGMRALQTLGIDPAVVHVNEGHAAFCLIERSRQYMHRHHLTFNEAWRLTQTSTVFTTHTPVPAGNEVFPHELLRTYLQHYVEQLDISWEAFLRLGAQHELDEAGFSMTVLGLRGSSFRNGVSQLHGAVARSMWHDTWRGFTVDEVPIRGITNGVHTATWVSKELGELYDQHIGTDWRTRPHEMASWERVDSIPDSELWSIHQQRRQMLVSAARAHVLTKHSASLTAAQATHIQDCLDPAALTIGFARRFATYKRADLFMHDMERLGRILGSTDRPVQLVLAGKAHPRDLQGKELIQKVHSYIRQHGLEHRIIFLEDYDMSIARFLVRGCDIWLNTPRRPHEASGTSGMKAAVNGGLHCSILDGWWAEAYDGTNGFAIGQGEALAGDEQDAADAYALYDLLEHKIVPLYYDRRADGTPIGWTAMMKRSIATNGWRFAATRMVDDYSNMCYKAAMHQRTAALADGARAVRDAEHFVQQLDAHWPEVAITHVEVLGADAAHVGNTITVRATVRLGSLSASNVSVQAMHGLIDSHGVIQSPRFAPLSPVQTKDAETVFEGSYQCESTGVQGCTVRIAPVHETFTNLPDAFRVTYAGVV
ncbi:MAG: glycosyltransferase family 1 protein [Candidatus Kapabacteria bacterium]|nr:glycosyltransferase family 1 protein [Candidatus Kapabacteria bacterium]